MTTTTERIIRGAIAGLAATVPMSAVMSLWHCRLPWHAQGPLPPAKITDAALRAVGIEHEIPEEAQTHLTLVNHLAYGASIGAAFEALSDPDKPPSVTQGILYGLGIWAGSYLGWLPAAGLHRSAAREPGSRNLLMIGAHVVWGASLSLGLQGLRSLSEQAGSRSADADSSSQTSGTPVATGRGQEHLHEEVTHDVYRGNQ